MRLHERHASFSEDSRHELVQIMVAAKADKTQVTAQGKTPLQLAQTNGASRATLALVDGGAQEANATDEDDGTDEAMGQARPATEEVPQTLGSLTAEQRAMLFID